MGSRPGLLFLFMFVVGALTAPAESVFGEMTAVRFSASSLEFGDSRLRGIDAELSASGDFAITAEGADTTIGSFDGPVALSGRLDELLVPGDGLQARGVARYEGLETRWNLASDAQMVSLCLLALAKPLEALVSNVLSPGRAGWVRGGEIDACIRYRQGASGAGAADFDLAVTGFSFDSPDGLYAGEGLSAELQGEIDLAGPPLLRAGGALKGGEILLDRFYSHFGLAPLRFSLVPEIRESSLTGLAIETWDDGALRVEARLEPGTSADGWNADIARLELAFPAAYSRYLEPIAAAWTLDGLQLSGAISWSGEVSARGIRSGPLEISDLSVVDTRRNRFALTGFETYLEPGEQASVSELNWRGLLLGKFNLGPGAAMVDFQPDSFALGSPLSLDVLGGQLRFDRLGYALPGGANGISRFEMKAEIADIDMQQLTAALGWPAFSGRLGGEVPAVQLENGVLSFDGGVRIDVFGGEVQINDLEVERPFGVLPSLSANVTLENLDLEQVTDTFEFGHIGGRVDGQISSLRLLDWSPVAFDAWIGTPQARGRTEKISRQAVNNLTTIGGGGVTTALTSPLLRVFKSFSYRRLGLGCRLRNYVCEVSGIAEDDDSVLLLEGAGIPKITVRAWNRRVDWPQMVANLVAISSGGDIRVGDTPEP